MKILKAEKSDALALESVEKQCFNHPNSLESIFSMLNDEKYLYFLAKCDKIIGYVGVYIVLDEADITNIAVLSTHRGQGISKKLFMSLLDELKVKNVKKLHLEVRESNEIARKLYESLGFIEISRRKNYYKTEDAITYTLEIKD